jgi:hypothetical protein
MKRLVVFFLAVLLGTVVWGRLADRLPPGKPIKRQLPDLLETARAPHEPRSACWELGMADGDDCTSYEDRIRRLQTANYVYNHPKKMKQHESQKVSFVISLADIDTKVVQDKLQLAGDMESGTLKIGQNIRATLSGNNFKIEPSIPQEFGWSQGSPLTVSWLVTPVRSGKDQTLTIDIFVKFEKGEGYTPPVLLKTFEAKINVDVDLWNTAVTFMASTTNLIGVMCAGGCSTISARVKRWGIGFNPMAASYNKSRKIALSDWASTRGNM